MGIRWLCVEGNSVTKAGEYVSNLTARIFIGISVLLFGGGSLLL
jgi:hypothetical protein